MLLCADAIFDDGFEARDALSFSVELVDLSVCEVVIDMERVGAHCKWRARRRSMRHLT
jgi:hypothetical protein